MGSIKTFLYVILIIIFSHQIKAQQFVEVSEQSGLIVASTTGAEIMSGGMAIADFDQDGWVDLYVLGCGTKPDYLYINNGDGTFREEGSAWQIPTPHFGKGASVADVDRDGYPDLYITSFGPADQPQAIGKHLFLKNIHGERFQEVAIQAHLETTSPVEPSGRGSAWADFNRDGYLDLYVGGWNDENTGSHLFRNEGDGTFSNQTVSSGLQVPDLWAFSPHFADLNGDFWPDLIVTADFNSSRIFINQGNETFTEITSSSNCCLETNGMGGYIDDFNGDGLPDWYATSITHPVIGDGNYLYINNGDLTFSALNHNQGLGDAGWSWGTFAFDYNHDTELDILATNGWHSEFENDPTRLFDKQPSSMTYVDVAASKGLVHTGQGRGAVQWDYDHDGDMDVLIACWDQPLALFRNDLIHGPDSNWIQIRLQSRFRDGIPAQGIGSRVQVAANGKTQTTWIHANSTYLSTEEKTAHFGLGNATMIDDLTITWPDGTQSIFSSIPVNHCLRIVASNLDSVLEACAMWRTDQVPRCLDQSPSLLDLVAFVNGDGQCAPVVLY